MEFESLYCSEYFNAAISVFSGANFIIKKNQINRFLLDTRHGSRDREQRSYSFTLCISKNLFSCYCCSQVRVLTKEGQYSACVHR